MNLEQRVQMLEQEVQLLKAQIQSTLLEIQEQMLNNTYPMLSTPDSYKPAPAEVNVPASPAKKIVLADLELEPDIEEEIVPVVQEVQRAHHNVHTVVLKEEPEPPQPPQPFETARWKETEQPVSTAAGSPVSNNLDWFELDNWVSEKVEKLGIQRTRELINLYAQRESFSLQERELLMQFIDIYDGEKTDKAEKPAKSSNGNGTHAVVSRAQESTPAKLAPLTRSVVEEIRAEQQRKTESSLLVKNGNHPFTKRQEMVLRLIAGILSTGDETSAASPESFSTKNAKR